MSISGWIAAFMLSGLLSSDGYAQEAGDGKPQKPARPTSTSPT